MDYVCNDKNFVGPLHDDVSTNRQIGIVSHGAHDCTSDSPSILSRVTDNLDFIEGVIRNTSNRQSVPQTSNCQTNPTVNPMAPSVSMMNVLKPWQRT